MKKEEFINFAFSSGLKILTNDGSIEKIKGIIGAAYCINDFPTYGMYGDCIDANLILRPLSDLTKPIEHNGEKFVPIESLKDVFMLEWCDLFDDSIDAILEFAKYKNFKKIEYLPFCLVQKFVEWKFDIAGLIEKGEAIDVNTLSENPYK